MLLLFILFVIFVSSIVRLLTAPFRYGRRYRYGYGCHRHHGGGLLPLLGLVFLARTFGRRF